MMRKPSMLALVRLTASVWGSSAQSNLASSDARPSTRGLNSAARYGANAAKSASPRRTPTLALLCVPLPCNSSVAATASLPPARS